METPTGEALITLLIPTRNRPKKVYELIESVEKKIKTCNQPKFEILISDNSDSELSINLETIKRTSSIHTRVISPEAILLTAEENLFFALEFVDTKYVWILGDDDPINFFEIDNLIDIVTKNQYKAYFWNSNLISSTGAILKRWRIPAQQDQFSVKMTDLVQRAGAWYATAGFSTWIIETKILQTDLARKQMALTKGLIYSHVFLFLKCIGEYEVLFINKPLVYYRMNDYDESGNLSNWQNYSSITGRYYRQAWTYDFPKEIDRLIEEGFLPNAYLGSIIEQDHAGNRFPLIFVYADLFFEQIEISLSRQSEVIPQEDLIYSLNLIEEFLPSLKLNIHKFMNINLQLIENRDKSSLFYQIKFKKFGADINLIRYNNWVQRNNKPFVDYISRTNIDVKKSENLNFIDFGINEEISYTYESSAQNAKFLNPNLILLRAAQYIPKKWRMVALSLIRNSVRGLAKIKRNWR